MRIDDVNTFKGKAKTAMQSWANKQIDQVMKDMPTIKTFAKNGVNNLMCRFDCQLNKYIDYFFLFAADQNGVINTDTMVDMLADMFVELPKSEYNLCGFRMEVGGGQAVVSLPNNMFLESLIGGLGALRFTREDILEFKNLLNN